MLPFQMHLHFEWLKHYLQKQSLNTIESDSIEGKFEYLERKIKTFATALASKEARNLSNMLLLHPRKVSLSWGWFAMMERTI